MSRQTSCRGPGWPQALRSETHPVSLRAGEVLYAQGERAKSVYGVCQGVLLLQATFADRRVAWHWLGPGQWIGLEPLAGKAQRASTVQAMTPVRLRGTDAQHLRAWLRRDPQLLERVLASWQSDFLQLQRGLLITRYGTASQRLAFLIHGLATCCEANGASKAPLPVKLTQAWLARQLGMKRETVARGLAELRERALIHGNYGRLTVRDLEGLERVFSAL